MSNILGQPPSNVPDPDRAEQSSSIGEKRKTTRNSLNGFMLQGGKITQDTAGSTIDNQDEDNIPKDTEPCENGLLDQIDFTQDLESA